MDLWEGEVFVSVVHLGFYDSWPTFELRKEIHQKRLPGASQKIKKTKQKATGEVFTLLLRLFTAFLKPKWKLFSIDKL